jgi:hypothetical protein
MNKKILYIGLIALLIMMSISLTYAITINSLPTSKHGLWSQKTEDTKLLIKSLTNRVTAHKIVSTVIIYNPTDTVINAQVSLTYEPDLTTETFDITINPLGTITQKVTVFVDVSLWTYTDVSIDEY